jgi:hypothetical protein
MAEQNRWRSFAFVFVFLLNSGCKFLPCEQLLEAASLKGESAEFCELKGDT